MESTHKSSQLSRRQFIGTAATITFVMAGGKWIPPALGNTAWNGAISPWVEFRPDGKIIIFNPAAEMGQGSMTALAAILAEEMDADWSTVVIENSPIEPGTYGLTWEGKIGGPMITVGSRTVRGYFHALRLAGAEIRLILRAAAAHIWQVESADVKTKAGIAIHPQGGKNLSYAELIGGVEKLTRRPKATLQDLKNPSDYTLVGKSFRRWDIPPKTTGQAVYSTDVSLPGAVYAVILRAPVHHAKPLSFNEAEVTRLPGVISVHTLTHGVGIVAKSPDQAIKAQQMLSVSWSEAKASGFDSINAFETYRQMSADPEYKREIIAEKGQMDDNLRDAVKVYTAEYLNDFVYHAQMEPLNAIVSIAPDGQSAEAWVGSQAPDSARSAIAKVLDVELAKVNLNHCFLGGGFGRRSLTDYAEEAAFLAKQVKKPVKLLWTRQDDLQYGAFRPASLQTLQVGLDKDKNIVAWHHITAGTGGNLTVSGATIDYYSIPHQRIEMRDVDHGVRTKHWRSVGHGPNKYAIEAMLDEVARHEGLDPFQLRRRLMKDSPRPLQVIEKVAAMCRWGEKVKDGRARGMAFSERSGALVGCVIELSLDRTSGKIRVHDVWLAMDAGIIVHPDNALAQLEGGVIQGLSSCLMESITFKEGKVEQSNFHDYPILRMGDIPEQVQIHLIPSTEAPQGVGEASLPAVGGALANAFLALTGKPLRHMPFTPEKVLQVLAG